VAGDVGLGLGAGVAVGPLVGSGDAVGFGDGRIANSLPSVAWMR
jgi:hypothetical protein